MTPKLKPFPIQLLWLAAAAVVSVLITYSFTGFNFDQRLIDIELHDAYYVMGVEVIIVPLFLILIFILFLAKEFRHHYSRKLPAVIIFITGILLLLMPAFLQLYFPVPSQGWTIYPPLSALEHDEVEINPLITIYWVTVIILQLLDVLCLLHVAYNFAKSKAKTG